MVFFRTHWAMPELSFLLIKPDGVANPRVLHESRAGLSNSGLDIVAESGTQLQAEDLEWLYPMLTRAQAPFTLEWMKLYLVERPLHLLVAYGEQALDVTNTLKHEVRLRWRRSSFANCLHAPRDASEMSSQIVHLWPGVRATFGTRLVPSTYTVAPLRGAWGRLAIQEHRASRIASDLWPMANGSPAAAFSHPSSEGEAQLLVTNDDAETIDYAASCILDVFPTWDPMKALEAVLEIDRTGRAVLAVGAVPQLRASAARLKSLGLNADVRCGRNR